jgi:LAS superfamily LD-carboxypeptidase LdcB
VNAVELTGRARGHVVDVSEAGCAMHAHVAVPFLQMRRAAAGAGLDLAAASGFRDFERQLAIWNGKYSGVRPVLDAAGNPADVAVLEPAQRVRLILTWSALPGASRHHWGTDLDLIDRAALPAGGGYSLTPAEYAPGGPFARLSAWLEENAARWGFFRPYRGARSAVQAEPWHFSFAPVAEPARLRLRPEVLREALEAAPLLGKEQVLADLGDLHARYVERVDLP